MVGRLMLDLTKAPAGGLDYEQRQELEQNCASIKAELGLDVLTIAEKGRILCAPHARGKVGESNHRELRDHAIAGHGEPFFAREDVTKDDHGKLGSKQVLVAEAARIAQ